MTITKITKENIDNIDRDMMKALEEVGRKYGITFNRKTLRYGQGDFRCTISAKVSNREEGVLTKEEIEYNLFKNMEKLPELGTVITVKNKKLTIAGWNNRARKYPVIVKDSDGKTYRMTCKDVKNSL